MSRDLGAHVVSKYFPRLIKEILNFKWVGFISVPEVNAPVWPSYLKRLFKNHIGGQVQPERDWLAFEFNGTTPSGRASQTTIGNSLNSLFYCYFYAHSLGWSTSED
jgi:hypothetical protein